jgi:hypothetical protein
MAGKDTREKRRCLVSRSVKKWFKVARKLKWLAANAERCAMAGVDTPAVSNFDPR